MAENKKFIMENIISIVVYNSIKQIPINNKKQKKLFIFDAII